ncbi:MAG: Tn3 family transposase [Solirubrobacteraceae bacterium]
MVVRVEDVRAWDDLDRAHGVVFGLAHLLGFELMPRIRNWKDLIFHRLAEHASYTRIDALLGDPGRNVID